MSYSSFALANRIGLVLVWVLLAHGLAAQTDPQKQQIRLSTRGEELSGWSAQLAREYRDRQTLAVAKARAQGWPIEQLLPDGSHIRLVGLDTKGNPMYYTTYNLNASISTRTSLIQAGGSAGYDLDGKNIEIGEWDGGSVLYSHEQFSGRINNRNSASNSDHATHVCGTMIGDGTGNSSAKGMAPAAKVKAYDWNSDESEMATEAAGGLILSNHSYGNIAGWAYLSGSWYWVGDPNLSATESYYFGWYNSAASTWDKIAYDAPHYLIVKAAGNDRGNTAPAGASYQIFGVNGTFVNSGTTARPPDGGTDGYDCIPTAGVAKNILTVGAVNDVLEYNGASSVVMSSFSGWGPTDDGRIKPDIVANGVTVTSSLSGANNAYGIYSGTSMASPNVTGSCALLQQLFYQYHSRYMLAATLKALVIHTADEAGRPGPDYAFGWGLMNAKAAADQIAQSRCNPQAIIEASLPNAAKYTLSIRAKGNEPLAATIVWTDPAGVAIGDSHDNTTPNLVNDLDIRLISGTSTFRPYVLDPANPAQNATTGDNFRDNVEKILIANPAADQEYTVEITHKGTLGAAQKFSLIISGISTGAIIETSLPEAILNLPYSYTLAEGNLGKLVWKSQNLPAGITLDSLNGRINGTPTEKGTFLLDFSAQKGSCSYAKTIKWVVEPSTLWNGTFWSHGRPDTTLHAILAADYDTELLGSFDALSLTIKPENTLRLHAAASISLRRNLHNQGAIDNCQMGEIKYSRLIGFAPTAAPVAPKPAFLVSTTPQSGNRLLVEWGIAAGIRSLVVVRQGQSVGHNSARTGEVFAANDDITTASSGPDGSWAVYDGLAKSCTIGGLKVGANYHVSVFAYIESPSCGPVYAPAAHASPTTGLEAETWASLAPVPTSTHLRLSTTESGIIRFLAADGREIHVEDFEGAKTFDLTAWSAGLYFVQISTNQGQITLKVVVE